MINEQQKKFAEGFRKIIQEKYGKDYTMEESHWALTRLNDYITTLSN